MAEDGVQLFEELMRFRPEGMTANAWAVRAGVSRTIWADLRRHGNPSRRTLAKLLDAAGSSLAEFEALRIGRRPGEAPDARQFAETGHGWRHATLRQLPVVWAAAGGRLGSGLQGIEVVEINVDDVIDWVQRPPSLAADHGAYAVTVIGESMWPRFRVGRCIAVTPSAPIIVGDDVLTFFTGTQRASLAELREQNARTVGLRQFNPPADFEVPAAEVSGLHKVLGELF